VTCPHDRSKVVETRKSPHGIRRRRECLACGQRYTTFETRVVQTIELRARAEADTPDAAEIAHEVVEAIQGELGEWMQDELRALPDNVVEALLEAIEAERDERALSNGRVLELTSGDEETLDE
jgi:transcriptional regulator NrdR family protein